MDPRLEFLQTKTRRHFLKESSLGLGSIAMASMNQESALAAPNENISNPLAPKQPHFKAKAKHVGIEGALNNTFQASPPSGVVRLNVVWGRKAMWYI